jgi:uncharacterized membrane protein (UPF0127 family)
MKQVRIVNNSRPLPQPLLGDWCASFLCRLRGLAWRCRLAPDEALILVQTRPSRSGAAIHMFGMFFDLAIIWLDEGRRVVDAQLAFRWRSILQPAQAALYVIECAPQRLSEFHVGDQIVFEAPPLD